MSRREFTKPVRRAAYERAKGICECHLIPGMVPCRLPLGPGNTYYEHVVCDGAGGDPTLENCACLTKTCWRLKTDLYDLPHVAKTKRMRDRDIGIDRGSGRGFYRPPGTTYDWDRKRYVKPTPKEHSNA